MQFIPSHPKIIHLGTTRYNYITLTLNYYYEMIRTVNIETGNSALVQIERYGTKRIGERRIRVYWIAKQI